MAHITRREFVSAAAATVGGLALSLELPAQEAARLPTAAHAPRTPSAFLQIGEDDGITIITPAVEMGQGGHTALPMIIMEELGGSWNRLGVADAPAAAIYNNPLFGLQATVGSFSVRGWYTELRRIGAAARIMLLQAAAHTWKVSANECSVDDSLVLHSPSGRKCSFGSVARLAASMPIPQDPPLKTVAQYTVIGSHQPRVDIPEKVDGSARFGIDMSLPDMLYATVKTSPTFGGKLKSFDDSACRSMPAFRTTVPLEDGVIVVANSYWQARKALARVSVDYDPGPLAELDSAKVSQQLRAGFDEPGVVARNDGDVEAALASAAKRVEATYEVPYLAHACMEPMNCTARVTDEGCDVWCGTQNPQAAQAAAAKVLGIPPARVKVHVQYLGGGFGRRGEADFVAQAVTAAKATSGRPVKLIWSREEDLQHDFYRPAAAIRFRGGLDAAGKLVALECKVVSASAPNFGRPGGPPFFTEAVADANYQIPNFRVTGLNRDLGVRFGFWRSVNHSHNPFMFEGFIDELARAAGRDPYQFRRAMLQHDREGASRQLAVLDLMAEKANWPHPPRGHAYGISAFGAFGSFIGTIVEVSVQDKVVTVHRVIQAIDCGVAIHPDNIRAQLEGGMVYGLTAVLRGEITLKNGAVTQTNFNNYPMLALLEMPRVESYIVPSTAAPGELESRARGPSLRRWRMRSTPQQAPGCGACHCRGIRCPTRQGESDMPTLNINGADRTIDVEADTPLLWVLRDELALTGTKFGCGLGLCGACSVLLNGKAVRSCVVPVSAVAGQAVVTIEGLSKDRSHPVQQAWIAESVPQCGYCQSGMILATVALLADKPNPTDAEIDLAITNICRCGTYTRVRQAIHRAARMMGNGKSGAQPDKV